MRLNAAARNTARTHEGAPAVQALSPEDCHVLGG